MIPLLGLLGAAAELVPQLGRWIGGSKAGEVAGKVAGVVTALTGQADPLQGLEAIKADPALLEKFKLDAEQLELEFFRTVVEDKKSARAHEAAMADRGEHTARNIAYMVVGGFMAVLLLLICGAFAGLNALKDQTVVPLITFAFGALSTKAGSIIDFYFGSSKSSERKEETIKEIARKG